MLTEASFYSSGAADLDVDNLCDVLCTVLDLLTESTIWCKYSSDSHLWQLLLDICIVARGAPSTPFLTVTPRLFEVLHSCWKYQNGILGQRVAEQILKISLIALGLSSEGMARSPPPNLLPCLDLAYEQFARDVLCDTTLNIRHVNMHGAVAAALTSGNAKGWWTLVTACENIINDNMPLPSSSLSSSKNSIPASISPASHPLASFEENVTAQTTALIANLFSFTESHLFTAHLNRQRAVALVRLLAVRFSHLSRFASQDDVDVPKGARSSVDGNDEDEDPDDDDGDFGNGIANGTKGLEFLVAQQLRRQLSECRSIMEPDNTSFIFQAILSPPAIGALFDLILPGGETTISDISSDEKSFDPVVALCSIYGSIIIHGKSTSDAVMRILFTLALGKVPNFLLRLWIYLRKAFPQVTDVKLGDEQIYSILGAPSALRATLLLFFSVYSRNLMAVNDEEFFEKQLPLSLDIQHDVSLMLRQYLFEILWKSPLESYDLEHAQLLLVTTRLFNRLYDRHARRDFGHLKRDHWHWPNFHSKELADAMGNADAGGSGGNRKIGSVFESRRLSMVLTCIPQVLHFRQRIRIFHRLIEEDKEALNIGDGATFFGGASVHDITVRRSHIYEDAKTGLNHLGPHLKSRIRVTFDSGIDGYQEPGIDGGGLFRDFMDALTERAFDPQYGMFNVTSDELLYPNPNSAVHESQGSNNAHLDHFRFMGRILGKAVYSQILVKPQFAISFLNKLLDRHNMINDLYTLDPEMYRNLMSLKDFVRKGMDLRELSLNFTVTRNCYGNLDQIELIPGGVETLVDNQNVSEYQIRVADYKLNRETAIQSRAFLRGFRDIIPVDWIRMFDARELQMVIGGEQRLIDIDNLMHFTTYSGGYHPSQEIMIWFWEIMRSLTPVQQVGYPGF